jgi:colanic acid biosynthesis glycosyl transferase WcaI
VKIHLISYLFAPDSLGGAALYTDLARFLAERGHEVRITTTFSFYPQYRYVEADRKQGRRDELFEGMPLRRIAMRLPENYRGWRRLIPEFSFWAALRRLGRFENWRPDVVVTGCPMMAQPLAAGGLYGGTVPLVVVVQDLMTEAAAKLGIIRQRGLLALLRAGERRALRRGSALVTISEDMKQRLTELTARDAQVIPNWVHGSLATALARGRADGVTRGPATLFYSGNLGVKQGLPDFLPLFFHHAEGWSLRVQGEGPEAAAMRTAHARSPRFQLGPLLEEGAYAQALQEAAVCLITQRAGAGQSFLPSKLLPALAAGTPVLAVCDPESPLGREVAAHGFGAVVRPGDGETLGRVLQRWRAEDGERARLRARAEARARDFSRETILPRYEALLLAQMRSR